MIIMAQIFCPVLHAVTYTICPFLLHVWQKDTITAVLLMRLTPQLPCLQVST